MAAQKVILVDPVVGDPPYQNIIVRLNSNFFLSNESSFDFYNTKKSFFKIIFHAFSGAFQLKKKSVQAAATSVLP